jgi:hypothetical protein
LNFNFAFLAYRGNHCAWQKPRRNQKKKARLDASQNALRVVEQAIGKKLVRPKASRRQA